MAYRSGRRAAQEVMRLQVTSTEPHTLAFTIPRLPAHTDQLLELDVGKHMTTVAVSATFEPFYDGINPTVPTELYRAASLILYMSDDGARRVEDYRWQEDVAYEDRRGAGGRPILASTRTQHTLYLAVFAPIALVNIVVSCRVHDAVSERDDVFHPWRIARMYNVLPENCDVVIEWFEKNQTKLILKSVELVDEEGENPLHHLCAACGDPHLGKFFLKHCGRFVRADLEDARLRTPLMCLLQRPDIYSPTNPRYFRALELLELFACDAAVSTDRQDERGNTMAHYASAFHRAESRILPRLLELGAVPNIKNNDGLTPDEFCRLPEFALTVVDVHEVERLLQRAPGPRAIPQRKLQVCNVLPPRRVNAAAASVALEFPPALIATDDDGLPVSGASPLGEDQLDWLTRLFKDLDKDRDGWLSRAEMRAMYKAFDNFGVMETPSEIDKLVGAMGLLSDDRISFDAFCMLLLKLNSR